MPATRHRTITDDQILAFIRRIAGASIEWTGAMPRDHERYDCEADTLAATLSVEAVRLQMWRNEIHGDSAEEEIQIAASIACTPDGLPENGCVVFSMRN